MLFNVLMKRESGAAEGVDFTSTNHLGTLFGHLAATGGENVKKAKGGMELILRNQEIPEAKISKKLSVNPFQAIFIANVVNLEPKNRPVWKAADCQAPKK